MTTSERGTYIILCTLHHTQAIINFVSGLKSWVLKLTFLSLKKGVYNFYDQK